MTPNNVQMIFIFLSVLTVSVAFESNITDAAIVTQANVSEIILLTTPQQHLPDRCLVKTDMGPCKHYIHKWTFNKTEGKCRTFVFGGCLGNENRFHSQMECLYYCIGGPNRKYLSKSYYQKI